MSVDSTSSGINCAILGSSGCGKNQKCAATEFYDGVWLTYDSESRKCVAQGTGGLFSVCRTSSDCGPNLICSSGVTEGGSTGYLCLQACATNKSGACDYGFCKQDPLTATGFSSALGIGVCAPSAGKCAEQANDTSPCATCRSWGGDCSWCSDGKRGFCTGTPADCHGTFINRTVQSTSGDWETTCQ